MKRDVELAFELGTLRYVDRTWRQFLSPEFANVAEHMFRMSWLALTLARMENNHNHEKILKMVMVHDVSESRAGDSNYVQKKYVKRDEQAAITDILANTVHSDEMTALWREAEEKKSAEAQIVKDADYLDQALELQEQQARGNTISAALKKRMDKHYYDKFYTQSAKNLLAEILDSNPHGWQQDL